jgi:hyperosmotically inducible protein
MIRKTILAMSMAALLGVAACNSQGSAEKAGENLDSAIEEATQGNENKSDGALERAGESLDKAAGTENNQDLGDTINDATDGDASTKP